MNLTIKTTKKISGKRFPVRADGTRPVTISLSFWQCRACNAPLPRNTIRRIVRCPVCGTDNERKWVMLVLAARFYSTDLLFLFSFGKYCAMLFVI